MIKNNASSFSSSSTSSAENNRLQLIETLKAPIIQLGKGMGYDISENYDMGAGPIHITWTIKPGSESLPDIRLGFICIVEYSESLLNESIERAMMNLVDKLIIVVPSESIAIKISESIKNMPSRSILQLRKYITVTTPSTLVPKTGLHSSNKRSNELV